MANPTEPSLAKAIEWGEEIEQLWASGVYARPTMPTLSICSKKLHRLVEAAKDWDSLKGYEKTWAEEFKTLREGNAEKDRQLQALRRQLDALGKEKAGLEYKLTEMEGFVKMHCQSVEDMTEAYDHKEKEVKRLRSQLAEKEETLSQVSIDGSLNLLKAQELELQLAEKERELKAYSNGALVYEDRIEELQRQRNEERRKVQEKERELEKLRDGKQWKTPAPAPTEASELARPVSAGPAFALAKKMKLRAEAEVEKVAKTFMKFDSPLATWVTRTETEQKHYCDIARYVIERGYSPTEKNCRAGREE